MGKWTESPHYINYGYLSMPKHPARAYKVDRIDHKIYPFTVLLPPTLKIDPRGHFTMLRCACIVWLDRVALKFRLMRERVANLCELLANYPNF